MERELVIAHIIDAPRALVFKAWTDPERMKRWWGPHGFTTTIHQMDVRLGGAWRFVMHGPDGRDYKNKITFSEVVKSERLVYAHSGGEDVEPVQFHVTVMFADQGGKTKLTMGSLFSSAAERDRVVKEYGAIEGGNQTLARLAEHLAKTDES